MATCCICSILFPKRADNKGVEKRCVSGKLRRHAVTVFDALQTLYDY